VKRQVNRRCLLHFSRCSSARWPTLRLTVPKVEAARASAARWAILAFFACRCSLSPGALPFLPFFHFSTEIFLWRSLSPAILLHYTISLSSLCGLLQAVLTPLDFSDGAFSSCVCVCICSGYERTSSGRSTAPVIIKYRSQGQVTVHRHTMPCQQPRQVVT